MHWDRIAVVAAMLLVLGGGIVILNLTVFSQPSVKPVSLIIVGSPSQAMQDLLSEEDFKVAGVKVIKVASDEL